MVQAPYCNGAGTALAQWDSMVLSVIFLLLKLSTSAHGATAKVLKLQALLKGQVITNCSATLVKSDNLQCRLITNYHCVRDRADQYLVSGRPENVDVDSLLLGNSVDSQITSVIKKDPGVDLAELSIPSNDKFANSCAMLKKTFGNPNVSEEILNPSFTLAARGWVICGRVKGLLFCRTRLELWIWLLIF